jgi:hypothetical protein
VINSCGIAYFNNTAAYAVAYAVHIGVKKITLFGCDYTYPNAHDAEKGRGLYRVSSRHRQGARHPHRPDRQDIADGRDAAMSRSGSTATTRSISSMTGGGDEPVSVTFTPRENASDRR